MVADQAESVPQFANAAEVTDALHTRDAVSVTPYEVRFTAIEDFALELERDYPRGAIADNIVRLSISNGPADLEMVTGHWVPGPERPSGWVAKYVNGAYLARNQLHKLSVYCGVARRQGKPPAFPHQSQRLLAQEEATALAVRENMHKLQAGMVRMRDLDIRGGGLYVESGDWTPHPDFPIEAPPKDYCATCGVLIHFANDQWRDADAKFEVLVPGIGRGGRQVMKLDHIHDPVVAGRQL